jgi:hypothetical protein
MKNFNELRNKMSPDAQIRVQKRVSATMETMPLDKLRRARSMTQTAVAERLHVDQGSVSKLENRADVYISTLREYVQALGGDLVLRADFPDGSINIEL